MPNSSCPAGAYRAFGLSSSEVRGFYGFRARKLLVPMLDDMAQLCTGSLQGLASRAKRNTFQESFRCSSLKVEPSLLINPVGAKDGYGLGPSQTPQHLGRLVWRTANASRPCLRLVPTSTQATA